MPETTERDHSAAMHEKHGEGLTEAQHHKVYAHAWQRGHGAGLHDVEENYVELAEFARDLLGID